MKTKRGITFQLVYLNAIIAIKKQAKKKNKHQHKKFSPVRATSLCASEDGSVGDSAHTSHDEITAMTDDDGTMGQLGSTRLAPAHAAECPAEAPAEDNTAYKSESSPRNH